MFWQGCGLSGVGFGFNLTLRFLRFSTGAVGSKYIDRRMGNFRSWNNV